MSGWIEVRCRVTRADFERLEPVLEALGAQAVTLADGDAEVFGEPGSAGDVEWAAFAVSALFDAHAEPGALVDAVHEVCAETVEVTLQPIGDADWDAAWRERWQPRLYAQGLCVCPTWCTPPAAARAVVRLDPGQAFGTGTHETTALCLDWLAEAAWLPGARLIDYGCGSGVLALAAARLGAREVCAVDLDPDALAVARENAALNELERRVRVGLPHEARVADALVANILLAPLLELAPRFAALLPAGGRLALSGLLAAQCEAVLAAYDAAFTMDAPVVRGEWVLLAGHRR